MQDGAVITAWHVTTGEAAKMILADGFLGGWGDDGYGVYLFTDLCDAQDYRNSGGWDGEGEPDQMEILQIETSEAALWHIEVNPEWPNPEFYTNVLRYPMDPDDEEYWTPSRCLLSGEPVPEI